MKKLNKFFAVLVALAMMATLCVSMAFAKSSTTNATDPYENATITVSKIFKIPAGVESPAESFAFSISKVSVDDNTTDAAKATMPALTLDNIAITAGTKASADNDIVKNGVITLPKLGENGFPHAGVYVYTLTETTDATNTDVKYNTGNDSYDLYIYVKNDGTVTPVVVDHGATPTADDPETPADENNKKDVDPVDPEDPGADTDPEDDQLSDVNFTNVYDVIADDTVIPSDGDDETPDVASAKVTKTVADNGYGDMTKQFKYTFAIDYSNYQGETAPTITYFKIAKDGTRTPIQNPVANGFTLADGESFAIFGAPVGTKYSVTEVLATDDDAAKNYQPKLIVTTKGTAGAEQAEEKGNNLGVTNTLIEDGSNIAAYTNTRDASTIEPEGILISNLPYIALALVAIGGLVAYVVVRRRNADEA